MLSKSSVLFLIAYVLIYFYSSNFADLVSVSLVISAFLSPILVSLISSSLVFPGYLNSFFTHLILLSAGVMALHLLASSSSSDDSCSYTYSFFSSSLAFSTSYSSGCSSNFFSSYTYSGSSFFILFLRVLNATSTFFLKAFDCSFVTAFMAPYMVPSPLTNAFMNVGSDAKYSCDLFCMVKKS